MSLSKIEVSQQGDKIKVCVGGKEMSNIESLSLDWTAGSVPRITIAFTPDESDILLGSADVTTLQPPPEKAPVKSGKPKQFKEKPIIPEEIKAEWGDYAEMRKKAKKPMTDRAIVIALNKLEELAPGNFDLQKKILNRSVFNCWQGLFPLETPMPTKASPCKEQTRSYDLEEAERRASYEPLVYKNRSGGEGQ